MNKTRNTLTKKLVALILAFALITSTAIMLGFGIKSVSASAATAASEGVERSGLGLSVNAITTDYLDLTELKDGSPIFNTSWITSQVNNANYISVGSTITNTFNKSEFMDVAEDFAVKLNFNQSVSFNAELFLGALSNTFKVQASAFNKDYVSQYYYLFQNRIERYTLGLPNYSSDLSSYKANLNSTYLTALQNLFNGQMTYDDFFDMYGTHVILKGVYGGMLNMSYHFASNKCDVGGNGAAKIAGGISAGINKVVNANSGASFDVNATMQCESGDIVEDFNLVARGGGVFTGTSMTDFSNSFKTWANSVVSSPVLIAPSSDGLVPLWELLPSSYSSRKEEFKNAFKEYAEDYNYGIYGKHSHKKMLSTNTQRFTHNRTIEYRITDDDIMLQPYDSYDLNKQKYGYDILNSYGYQYVDISINLQMKEVNRGYQHFCLYLDSELIQDKEFEYGGTALKTDYTYVTKTFTRIELTRLKDPNINKFRTIYIRYGATGSQDDDWCNKNCTLTISITK